MLYLCALSNNSDDENVCVLCVCVCVCVRARTVLFPAFVFKETSTCDIMRMRGYVFLLKDFLLPFY